MSPTVHYFAVRGRAEPIKIALAIKNVPFNFDGEVSMASMKADLGMFTFGQCPRYYDDELPTLCQTNAILRHVGRKFDLYGNGLADAAHIDEVMEGTEAIRTKYYNLVITDKLQAASKEQYLSTHIDPSSAKGSNGGAHFTYLSNLLTANGGGQGFIVGSAASIADAAVFDIVDLHMRIYEAEMKKHHPLLVAHHERVAAIPGLKAYLASERRLPTVNGNGLG